ncbi:ABC transporter permease subunit [Sulfitobacter albidus]|uniref:ABC transporter permease subunit n=1 Tax=Sulfitobacter albidus TaxID=2829501 RepID=A0A975JE12_9RHOB|nr:ABC transporter permease subunit [Sulfitobacter albidus]QUJ76749.1 ABC transporter permease subunit [Sulfitobacter albidus]
MQSARDTSSVSVVFVSLAALVALWAGAAWITADASVLPGPAEVWRIATLEAQSGELLRHIAATLRRVAFAFALAFGLGALLGLALGLVPWVNRWLGPWVTVLLNVPALVVIVLCYLWIGLNEVAAITAVAVNKTAMVAVTLREGLRALDPGVADMARVFRMSRAARLRHIIAPQLAPYIAGAVRNGLAIIWKIVLVVEFLGRSDGVGFQIHLYFQLFETGYVMAYALSFVGVMLAIEYGLLQRWESHSRRWRVT